MTTMPGLSAVRLGLASSRACVKPRHFSGPNAVRKLAAVTIQCKADKKDGSVIDKPTTLPGIDLNSLTVKKNSPMYRVMLHNDAANRREYVVKVLMQVVDGLTVDDAVNIMNTAHMEDVALVIMCAQEEAENYVAGLRRNGLTSSLEPQGGGGSGESGGE